MRANKRASRAGWMMFLVLLVLGVLPLLALRR